MTRRSDEDLFQESTMTFGEHLEELRGALFRAIAGPLLVAFTPSSSSATLPVSMQAARDELDVEPGVSGFVLPLGAC